MPLVMLFGPGPWRQVLELPNLLGLINPRVHHHQSAKHWKSNSPSSNFTHNLISSHFQGGANREHQDRLDLILTTYSFPKLRFSQQDAIVRALYCWPLQCSGHLAICTLHAAPPQLPRPRQACFERHLSATHAPPHPSISTPIPPLKISPPPPNTPLPTPPPAASANLKLTLLFFDLCLLVACCLEFEFHCFCGSLVSPAFQDAGRFKGRLHIHWHHLGHHLAASGRLPQIWPPGMALFYLTNSTLHTGPFVDRRVSLGTWFKNFGMACCLVRDRVLGFFCFLNTESGVVILRSSLLCRSYQTTRKEN